MIFHRCREARKCNYGEIALGQMSTNPGLPGSIPHLSLIAADSPTSACALRPKEAEGEWSLLAQPRGGLGAFAAAFWGEVREARASGTFLILGPQEEVEEKGS